MIHIENLTINVHAGANQASANEVLGTLVVREELVNTLRIISTDSRFFGQEVVIPEECEKYGFAEGTFDLPILLHFLADMLE